MHPALLVTFRHLLVDDPAAGGHPLNVPRRYGPAVSKAVAVIHGAGEHICDGLYSAVRMPGEPCKVVLRAVVSKVVQEEKRIQLLGFAEAESAAQPHPRALDCRLRGYETFDWSD